MYERLFRKQVESSICFCVIKKFKKHEFCRNIKNSSHIAVPLVVQ